LSITSLNYTNEMNSSVPAAVAYLGYLGYQYIQERNDNDTNVTKSAKSILSTSDILNSKSLGQVKIEPNPSDLPEVQDCSFASISDVDTNCEDADTTSSNITLESDLSEYSVRFEEDEDKEQDFSSIGENKSEEGKDEVDTLSHEILHEECHDREVSDSPVGYHIASTVSHRAESLMVQSTTTEIGEDEVPCDTNVQDDIQSVLDEEDDHNSQAHDEHSFASYEDESSEQISKWSRINEMKEDLYHVDEQHKECNDDKVTVNRRSHLFVSTILLLGSGLSYLAATTVPPKVLEVPVTPVQIMNVVEENIDDVVVVKPLTLDELIQDFLFFDF